MGGHVFISYSHRDDDSYADALAAYLKHAGLAVWLDKEIISGDRWEHVIRTMIDSCVAFVVLMSPAAEVSDWVTREIHRAETKAKPILPLHLRGGVFFRLSNIHYEDVQDGQMPGPAFVDRLRVLATQPEAPRRQPPDGAVAEALASIAEVNEVLRGFSHPTNPDTGNGSETARVVPRLVRDFALAEVARIAGYLKLMGRLEDLAYDGEDRDWLLALTRACRQSMDATSFVTVDAGGHGEVDGGIWYSDLGRQYLEAQRHGFERGVRIRRLFIVDRPEIRQAPDFVNMLRAHMELGVQVRTLYPEELAGSQRAALSDFIIFDAVLSYHISLSPTLVQDGLSTVVTTTLVTDTVRVQNRIEQYGELWNAATRPDPPGTDTDVGPDQDGDAHGRTDVIGTDH